MLQSIAVFEQDPENMINVHSVFVWLHRALLKRLVLELCCTGPGEINTASNQMASPLLPRLRQPRRLLLLLVLLLLILIILLRLLLLLLPLLTITPTALTATTATTTTTTTTSTTTTTTTATTTVLRLLLRRLRWLPLYYSVTTTLLGQMKNETQKWWQ